MRKTLENLRDDLVSWTTNEVEEAIATTNADLRNNPETAIKYFYPRTLNMLEKHRVFGFAPNDAGNVRFLHFQALGIANILDIRDKYKSETDFHVYHGLTPAQLALEINDDRALAIFNGNLEKLSKQTLKVIRPLIDESITGPRRLQLGHIRTQGFNGWIDDRISDYKDQGNEIYERLFRDVPADQIRATFESLRIFSIPDTASAARTVLNDVIRGRWVSISCLRNDVPDPLIELLEETHSFSDRAKLFNVIKDRVCASVTAARGGIFRMTPRQDSQNELLSESIKSRLERLVSDGKPFDMESRFAQLLVEAGKEGVACALPDEFSYDKYTLLNDLGALEPLQNGLKEAVKCILDTGDTNTANDIQNQAKKTFNRIMANHRRLKNLRKRPLVDKLDEIRSWAWTVASDVLPVPTGTAEKIITKGSSTVSKKLRMRSPGGCLAQGVIESNQKIGQ